MDPASKQPERIPLQEACQRLRMSREQLIPRIQKGELEGGQDLGRWFVTLESIDRYIAEQQATAAGST